MPEPTVTRGASNINDEHNGGFLDEDTARRRYRAASRRRSTGRSKPNFGRRDTPHRERTGQHEALVAALTSEHGAQARDDDEAPQSAEASAETATKGDAQRDSEEATREDTTGEASNAEAQRSTASAHFGWLGVQLAAGMTTFAGRHAEH
ncbi:hypothetical protein ERJ75_001722900 [Trypanosoma vivax]|nr:hypothetical protein ERJ75_001722900 [Trypanosoma vivax]